MICENCNARIKVEQAEFCPKCGYKLVGTPVQTPSLPEADDANAAKKDPDAQQSVMPKKPVETDGSEKEEKPEEPARLGSAAEPKKVLRPENFVKPKGAKKSKKRGIRRIL